MSTKQPKNGSVPPASVCYTCFNALQLEDTSPALGSLCVVLFILLITRFLTASSFLPCSLAIAVGGADGTRVQTTPIRLVQGWNRLERVRVQNTGCGQKRSDHTHFLFSARCMHLSSSISHLSTSSTVLLGELK